jgi:hypothetical protein
MCRRFGGLWQNADFMKLRLDGFLGEQIGLRATLWVGALGIALAWLWVLFSLVSTLRSLPKSAEESAHPVLTERTDDSPLKVSP